MISFSIRRKNTPVQKHREEEEAKKKRAEDETARLYAESVESFQGDSTPGSKTFVRGGTVDPNEKLKGSEERTSSERMDRWDDISDSSRKRPHGQGQSESPPPQKSLNQDRENDLDRDRERHRDRDRALDLESDRGRYHCEK